jgi:hypothetical protein
MTVPAVPIAVAVARDLCTCGHQAKNHAANRYDPSVGYVPSGRCMICLHAKAVRSKKGDYLVCGPEDCGDFDTTFPIDWRVFA